MAAIDTLNALRVLFVAYPNTQVVEETIAVYFRLLQDIPPEEFQTVIDQCIMQNKFMPSIAELRETYRTLTMSMSKQEEIES